MTNETIGFIGFGLIAGCIARCIREKAPDTTLLAYNYRHPDIKPGLQQALDDGVLSSIEHTFDGAFKDCDIIFLCAPVITNIKYLKECKNFMKKDCILTDVGSVKGNIHDAVSESGLNANFIGGHPMAGSEKTGYENSSKEILHGAFYLLTTTPETPDFMIKKMQEITNICECRNLVLKPEEHDIAAAAISHVPHILSYTLVNTVREHDNDQHYMKQFAAGGFRDMTRIAASSPEMWQNIVLANKKAVLTFLSQYQVLLEEFKQELIMDDKDGLLDFFRKSKEYRDTFTF